MRPWAEHPRPQMRRDRWLDLNGEWEFAFDDADVGLRDRWAERRRGPFDRAINVPFAWQAKLSGIGEDPDAVHDIVWYRRLLGAPELAPHERLILHFDAVDYEARVWVNGALVATHVGGQTSFSADVTDALRAGDNSLVLRARDYALDPSIPRGKQAWRERPSGIHYTRTTGIHGSVWAEPVDRMHVEELRLTPDVQNASLGIAVRLADWELGTAVRATASVDGERAGQTRLEAAHANGECVGTIALDPRSLALWEPVPGTPALYDLDLAVIDRAGAERDRIHGYFGMRQVEIADGRFLLNGTETFLRGVLDQRWDRDGLLTPANGDVLRHDVELAIGCGFNFARIHQKREDMRYYAWADRLGLMLTGEAANAYHFTPSYERRFTNEWTEIVNQLRNSPAIIAWLPINESWGCRSLGLDGQPVTPFNGEHASAIYDLTKSLDPTRPCASNDGWEHTRSDFTGVHSYERVDVLRSQAKQWESRAALRSLYVDGYEPAGDAVIYTEFGGLFRARPTAGFNYGTYEDDEDFYRRFEELISTLVQARSVAGFVYTQWKDVETETNGLLRADGSPKWDIERIRRAVTRPREQL